MGGKRTRSQSAAPANKKAKVVKEVAVVLSPIEENAKAVMEALNGEWPFGLSEVVSTMVQTAAKQSLEVSVVDRHEFHTGVFTMVETTLTTAKQALADTEAEEKQKHASLEEAVQVAKGEHDGTVTELEGKQQATAAAAEARLAADKTEKEAKAELKEAQAEQEGLPSAQSKLADEVAAMDGGVEALAKESLTKAEEKSLLKLLRDLDAEDSMVAGIPLSIGQNQVFAQMVLTQATKLCTERRTESQKKLDSWDDYVQSVEARVNTATSTLETAEQMHTDRQAELKVCQAEEKGAESAVKAADKAHQAAVKASNTQSTVVEEATSQVNTYNAVLSAFDFCKTFGTPVEEVAEVVEEAKDEVTAVDSNDEVKVRFETTVEEATVEAVTEEPIPEAMTDEPNAEAMTDEPCAEAMTDEPNVEAVTEEPHVEATTVEATEPVHQEEIEIQGGDAMPVEAAEPVQQEEIEIQGGDEMPVEATEAVHQEEIEIQGGDAMPMEATEAVHQEEIEIQGDGLGLESRQMSPTPVKMMSPTPGKSPQVDFHVKENTPMQDGNAMSFDVY